MTWKHLSATQRGLTLSQHVDSRYPITQTLYDIFIAPNKGWKKNSHLNRAALPRTHWRSEIIDEKLCDDVLRYLSPTLDAYKGATIIDVNPGSCIWSRKIHEYLKPNCHLLMEPEKNYYEPFVKPLLEQPGSKYRFTPLAGAHARSYWTSYNEVLTDKSLMPPRKPLKPGDPALREIDTSLLVIGNLWRRDQYRALRDVSIVPMLMGHMTYAALTNQLFHRSGLVRMLWWLPEVDMLEILSNNVHTNKSLGAQLSIGADITQIVGSKSHEQLLHDEQYYLSRPTGLTSVASAGVAEATRKLKLETGVEREELVPSWTGKAIEPLEGVSPLETSCSTLDELRDKVAAFVARLESTRFTPNARSTTENLEEHKKALVYPQTWLAVKQSTWIVQIKGSDNRAMNIARAADLTLQFYHLEAELAALSEKCPDHADLAELTELVLSAGQQIDKVILETTPDQLRKLLEPLLDYLRTAYTLPPAVMRDSRQFEPLKADEREFWPRHHMALVMVTPRSEDLQVPGVINRRDGADACQELIKQMYFYRTEPLPTALNRIAPGAADALIPMIPGINDIRKGGRLDPMKIKVRDLSTDMLRSLIKAFCDWPFKPTNLQLMLSSNSDMDEMPQDAQDE